MTLYKRSRLRLVLAILLFVLTVMEVGVRPVLAGIRENPPPLPGWTHSPRLYPDDSPQRHGILLAGSTVTRSSPVVADIDGNAANGLEVAVGGSDGILYAYHSDGSLLWARNVLPYDCVPSQGLIDSSPAVGSLYGDGVPYIVVGYGTARITDCDGGVVAFRGRDGDLSWRFSLRDWGAQQGYSEALYGVISSPSLADTDSDGQLEIGFGGLDRNVYLLNANGTPRWYYHAADTSWSSPAFSDLNGDGRMEMIAGTDISANHNMIPPTQDGGYVYAFNTEQRNPLRIEYNSPGAFIWRIFFDQVIYSSPVIADFVPGSENLEIAIGSGCYFPVGESDKRGKWVKILRLSDGATLQTLNAPSCFSSSVAAGDIDDDGQLEIVATVNGNPAGDNLSRVVAWDVGNPTPKWMTVPYNPNSAPHDPTGNDEYGGDIQSPLIADLDGNGSLEVIAANFWSVHVFRGKDGVPLTCQSTSCGSEQSLFAWGTVKSTPAIADINLDGKPDVVIGGMHIFNNGSGMLYAWTNLSGSIISPPGFHQAYAAPWPMFRHDALNSGVLDNIPPSNPSDWSSTPLIGSVVSDSSQVVVQWTQPGRDIGSGLAGYSIIWNQLPNTMSPALINYLASTRIISRTVSAGSWYVHIRSVDRAGNGADTTLHIGPFIVDTTPPTNPSSVSAMPVPGDEWHKPQPVAVFWAIGGNDTDSGLAGYSVIWDKQSSTLPDATIDISSTEMGITAELGDGVWYAHVRAIDRAGNAAVGALHVGPFRLDGLAPKSRAASPSEVLQSTIPVNWGGTDEGGSGIAEYALQVRVGEQGSWTTWTTSANAGSAVYNSNQPCGTIVQFRSVATDRAGNIEERSDSSFDSATFMASPYTITGRVVNNIGQPVYNAHVSSMGACAQMSSDVTGWFEMHFFQPTVATLSVTRSDFGQLPPLESRATGAGPLELVVPPADNAIDNGEFETGDLSGWAETNAQIVTPGYSGRSAARLTSTGSLEQSIVIPRAAILSLMYWVDNASSPLDIVKVEVKTGDPDFIATAASSGTFELKLPLATDGWNHAVLDLGALANMTAQLSLEVVSTSVDARFDDITIGSARKGVYFTYAPLVTRR